MTRSSHGTKLLAHASFAVLGLVLACSAKPSDFGEVGSGDATTGDSDDASESDPTATSGAGDSTGGGSTDGGPGDEGTNDTANDEGSSDSGPPPVDACDAIDRTCATLNNGGLVLFELVSGSVIANHPVAVDSSDTHSITWVGDHVYACTGEPLSQTLVQIDANTGALVDSGLTCNGVTSVAGQLLVRLNEPGGPTVDGYAYYDDFAAVMAGTPSSMADYSPDLERITATEGTLVSSHHSTDHIERFDLATGASQGDVPLTGHDDWVMGMTVVEGQLVIGTWFSNDLRHIAFDLATGARSCEMQSTNALDDGKGLACQPG